MRISGSPRAAGEVLSFLFNDGWSVVWRYARMVGGEGWRWNCEIDGGEWDDVGKKRTSSTSGSLVLWQCRPFPSLCSEEEYQ